MKRASHGAPAVAPGEHLPQAPERQRIEARHHQLALRHQHPLGLAQHVVRVVVGLEHVRQHHQVRALRRERQLQRVGRHRGAGLERDAEAERDAVAAQEIGLRQADLDRAVAERIVDRVVELGQLPVEHVAPLRRDKPL